MTPTADLLQKVFELTGALSVLTGAMAWWRKGSTAEDEMVSAAADTVLDALSDADTIAKTRLRDRRGPARPTHGRTSHRTTPRARIAPL